MLNEEDKKHDDSDLSYMTISDMQAIEELYFNNTFVQG